MKQEDMMKLCGGRDSDELWRVLESIPQEELDTLLLEPDQKGFSAFMRAAANDSPEFLEMVLEHMSPRCFASAFLMEGPGGATAFKAALEQREEHQRLAYNAMGVSVALLQHERSESVLRVNNQDVAPAHLTLQQIEQLDLGGDAISPRTKQLLHRDFVGVYQNTRAMLVRADQTPDILKAVLGGACVDSEQVTPAIGEAVAAFTKPFTSDERINSFGLSTLAGLSAVNRLAAEASRSQAIQR